MLQGVSRDPVDIRTVKLKGNVGGLLEICLYRAGTEDTDFHLGTFGPQFLPDPFRQPHHIVFGGIVRRHQRPRHESGDRSYVKDPAVVPFHHVGQIELHQRVQTLNVGVNHLELFVQIGLAEFPEIAKPGVIDQKIDVRVFVVKGETGVFIADIRDDHGDLKGRVG